MELAFGLAVVGAKGGNFDDFASEADVGKAETSPDDLALPAKDLLDLLGCGVRGDVKVLGVQVQQQVPYATANEKCLIAVIMQAIQCLYGGRADVLARDGVLVARGDGQLEDRAAIAGAATQAVDQGLDHG